MSTDFDSDVVLANSARALRTEVLPTITDEHARRTLIQIIAVMEAHLDQLRAGPTTTNVDGGLLSAFGGRLAERDDRGD